MVLRKDTQALVAQFLGSSALADALARLYATSFAEYTFQLVKRLLAEDGLRSLNDMARAGSSDIT